MSGQFWLSEEQLLRISGGFPLSHGVPRVDDRKVVSGIIHVIRNGLRWRDAPEVYGPHKALYNRFIRGSRMGVCDPALVAEGGTPERLMIPFGRFLSEIACRAVDAAHLKAHRAVSSLKGGMFPALSAAQRVG